MKKYLTTIFLFAAAASFAAELESLEDIYEAETQKIEDKYMGFAAQSIADYQVELSKLEKAIAKKGNLEGVIGIRKEKERFADNKAPTIAEGFMVEKPVELKNLQQAYNAYYEKQEAARKQEISKLTRSYSSRLKLLKTSLTNAMKIDAALAVQKEIEGVAQLIQQEPTSAKASPVPLKPKPAKLRNIAMEAEVKASSDYGSKYAPAHVVDGTKGVQVSGVWSSAGGDKHAWIELSWDKEQVVHKVVLYDRPLDKSQILDAELTAEGSEKIKTGELPNDGSAKEFDFTKPVRTRWLKFQVIEAKGWFAGLSEIEVFAE